MFLSKKDKNTLLVFIFWTKVENTLLVPKNKKPLSFWSMSFSH